MMMKLNIFSLAAGAAALLAAVVPARPVANATAPSTVLPFKLANKHIMLPVTVNAHPLTFCLDTGDKVGIIDLERARALGLEIGKGARLLGTGGKPVEGGFVSGATCSVTGLKEHAQPVVVAIPLRMIAQRIGSDFDGILGADFIRQFVVEVDYQASTIRLHDLETFRYDGKGEVIPLRFNASGHPVFDAELTPAGGQPIAGSFVLDIGSGGELELSSRFIAAHAGIVPPQTIRAIGKAGAGGQTAGRVGRVSAFRLGRFTLKSPIAYFSTEAGGPRDGVDGSIGYWVASRFRIFLDYPHDRMILEPNERFGAPSNRATSGVALEATGDDYRTFRVTEILEDSPAAAAGLQLGDVVESVDGKPAAELSLSQIFDLFEQPVSRKLTVRRGDEMRELTLTPRPMV